MKPLLGVFLILSMALLWMDVQFHGTRKSPTLKNATIWSLAYIAAALIFAGYLFVAQSPQFASLFLTAYLMEKALSVDNLIVFGAVFAYFNIPGYYQHKVLHYGILGAAVFRLIFVLVGTEALALIGRPVEGLFAILVGYSAWQIIKGGWSKQEEEEEVIDHSNRWYIRWTKKIFPVTGDMVSSAFFTKTAKYPTLYPANSKLVTTATPMFLCLIAMEVTDIMFAFDSMPTVIAVARDPLIVYPAMMFAIFGLRSMYFVLYALRKMLQYLDAAVGAILVFVTLKLALRAAFEIDVDPYISLGIVLGLLTLGVLVSLWFPKPKTETFTIEVEKETLSK